MLRRFADHRLRAALATQIEETQEVAAELADACRQLVDTERALETQTALTERWRLIAQGAQNDPRAVVNRDKENQQ